VENQHPSKKGYGWMSVMNGRATALFWLHYLRRLGVGTVLIYVIVCLTLGQEHWSFQAFCALAGLWAAVLSAATRWGALRCVVNGVGWPEVIASNVALALVLGELSLQGYARASGRSLLLEASLDAYRLEPGRDYGDGLVGNRLGYPGPELPALKTPGLVRIAALGDSFAVGPAVPFADCYLTRLGQELSGIELGNFGVSSTGPREYRLILERDVWPVQPDLILLSIFVGNDITETIAQPRRLDPRRHALTILCQRGWRLARELRRTAQQPQTATSSRVGRPVLSLQTFQEIEARRLAVCCKLAPAGMEKMWQTALADLDRIALACRQRNVALAVVLIPDEFQVNEAVLSEALVEAGLGREQVDLEGPQRRLATFWSERHVPCLDLLPALRATPDCYAPRDTHWNVVGNHLAARAIADWLCREGMVKAGLG
jgi:hypothetical protein